MVYTISMTHPLPASTHSLAEVLDDCQKWYSEILSALFYKGGPALSGSSLPRIYSEWVKSAQTQTVFRLVVLEKLRTNSEKLNTALQEVKKHTPPQISDFQNFTRAYEGFVTGLNEIQCDFLLSSKGMDIQTGFKSSLLIMPEMKREFERRGRHGNPFSVIMIRIDNKEGTQDNEERVRIMATAINQCLRGFDDVYRMNDLDILINLKLSDIKGGLRFVERIKDELKILNAEFTFSSCVAEPDPSNDLTKFLQELEYDLASAASHGGGQTIKFEEISPMQRFIASMKEKSN